MLGCGERGWNLKHLINLRLGLTIESERLPEAFLHPYEDAVGERESQLYDFYAMREAYLLARGWDPATSVPTETRLRALGLIDLS
jgi:aldehyde:ferredoxin oxidoreductase